MKDHNVISELSGESSKRAAPVFTRLPKQGKLCSYSALTRSHLNKLILPCPENGFKPPVDSFVVSQPGKRRGVRLIKYASLMTYLSEQEKKQKPCVKANDNSIKK